MESIANILFAIFMLCSVSVAFYVIKDALAATRLRFKITKPQYTTDPIPFQTSPPKIRLLRK